jgi:DNA replication and repair protein RecF
MIGPNATGKTNILESIYLLSTGKSFRVKVEEEMVNYEEDLARVNGEIETNGDGVNNLEVVLTRGEISIEDAKIEKVARKRLLVNGVPKRLIDFSGLLKIVMFSPEDLDLVSESPSIRRKYLDMVLSQVDREYRRANMSYEKGLKQRNRLLFRIREEGLSRSQLLFWDRLLIKNGDLISQKREEFVNFCNSVGPLNDQVFSIEYDKSAISDARLEQYAAEEVAAATTLVGPHRDDLIFKIIAKEGTQRDLARYGSRGEQRMGVLWVKMAELKFIEEKSQDIPTLLLDDIFSELDHEHRDVVMDVIKKRQTIITTADEHFVEGFKGEKIELV